MLTLARGLSRRGGAQGHPVARSLPGSYPFQLQRHHSSRELGLGSKHVLAPWNWIPYNPLILELSAVQRKRPQWSPEHSK